MAAVTDLLFYDVSKVHMSGFTFYSGGAADYNFEHGTKVEGYSNTDYDETKYAMVNHAQIP